MVSVVLFCMTRLDFKNETLKALNIPFRKVVLPGRVKCGGTEGEILVAHGHLPSPARSIHTTPYINARRSSKAITYGLTTNYCANPRSCGEYQPTGTLGFELNNLAQSALTGLDWKSIL